MNNIEDKDVRNSSLDDLISEIVEDDDLEVDIEDIFEDDLDEELEDKPKKKRTYSKSATRRIRNVIAVCFLSAIVLTVSTYAWFVSMKSVNVSNFDVKIASTDSLMLSMNAKDWYYNLDPVTAPAYADNKNNWLDGEGEGLSPISTIGTANSTSSSLDLFEKGSLTATKGGYRLLASKIDNSVEEQNGYVSFDLFIRNMSGEAYYTNNNINNEEAIYLNTNSEVKVGQAGVAGTGIENSVRVAFMQIGRVEAGATETTDYDNITNLKCTETDTYVGEGNKYPKTGICRDAQIWEPNDMNHVQNAINWYEKSCKLRTGATITTDTSYSSTACSGVTKTTSNTTYNHTYAIANPLLVNSNVDVYDGEYNGYTANVKSLATYKTDTIEAKNATKLVDYPYFRDSDKIKTGNQRPEFMSLAPNSITKVKVFIYIEGQDIDNYDFTSLGQQISVNFGFTKERYNGSDIDYVGPEIITTGTDKE